MDGVAAVLIAVITTAGTLGVAYIGAKRINFRSPDATADGATMHLREMLDVASAEMAIWRAKHEDTIRERDSEIADLQRKLELTQHDSDDCARRLDAVYSELRRHRALARSSAQPEDHSE